MDLRTAIKRSLRRLAFMMMPKAKKEKLFITWLVDQSLATGLMPPADLLTKEQQIAFARALKMRREYESLFQEIPWPNSLMEREDEISRQD